MTVSSEKRITSREFIELGHKKKNELIARAACDFDVAEDGESYTSSMLREMRAQVPKFSTDINAAYQLLDLIRPATVLMLRWGDKMEWSCTVRIHSEKKEAQATSPSPSIAICLAVLKFKGVVVD